MCTIWKGINLKIGNDIYEIKLNDISQNDLSGFHNWKYLHLVY